MRQVRGFFTVSRDGNKINVSETLDGKLDYWLVVGTHPLLVLNGNFHDQAAEDRYVRSPFYCSAIGTKDGKVCFAVSEKTFSMRDWASMLQQSGYTGAINLDGGSISQMAVRENGKIETKGKGNQATRLVIFEQKK